MKTLDKINALFSGRRTVQYAGMGLDKKWKLRSNRKSQCHKLKSLMLLRLLQDNGLAVSHLLNLIYKKD